MKELFQSLAGGFLVVWLIGLGLGMVFSYLGAIFQAVTSSEKE